MDLAVPVQMTPVLRSFSNPLGSQHPPRCQTLIDLLRTHGACSDAVLQELVKTPKMRAMLKAADKLRQTQRRPEPPAPRRRRQAQATEAVP